MAEKNGTMRTVVLWSAGVAVVALVIAGALGWVTGAFSGRSFGPTQRIAIDEQRSVDASQAQRVKLSTVAAGIEVREIEGNQVTVHLHGQVTTNDKAAVPELTTSMDGGTLVVKVSHKPLTLIGFHSGNLTLDVGLPRNLKKPVEVSTVSGAIDLSGNTFTSLAASTTSGEVRLVSVDSPRIELRTVSGQLAGEKITADALTADTTSGQIDLATTAPNLDLHSVSGQVRVAASSPPAHVRIRTTSGEVALQLPPTSQFALDARSTSGQIQCDFPVVMSGAAGRKQVAGSVGTPSGATVQIRTTSGGIVLSK